MRIFTDGGCRPSLNKGAIGIVYVKDNKVIYTYSKCYKGVTNNQMELLAIGKALDSIKKPIDSLEIISDSEYALGSIFKNWNGEKNRNLIDKIKLKLSKAQKLVSTPIKFSHVKGHQELDEGDAYFNNLADKLCTKEMEYL